MRYNAPYDLQEFNQDMFSDILIDELKDSTLFSSEKYTTNIKKRKSKNTFINDQNILKRFLNVTKHINNRAQWNFNIDTIEPLQYGEYSIGGKYNWHVDQHHKPYNDNRVRKISFSILLNDEFEGGEFDLECYDPSKKPRYKTIQLKKYEGVFFQSDWFHRVRPVTAGIRKSLVGWTLGPKFI